MRTDLPSVQLFTVRDDLQADISGTLARLAAIGYTQVEPFRLTEFPDLSSALTANGLNAPTAHSTFIGTDANTLFEHAAALGVELLVDPFIDPDYWQTNDDIARTADAVNAAAVTAAKYGLRIGYHNHAHELQTHIGDVTGLEYFATQLSPEVALEVDTYWVAVGGADPVAILNRLGDRVAAIHVKDGPATTVKTDQVALGQGALNIPGIIAAAPSALRVVELDDTSGNIWDAVAAGYRYLTV